MLRLPRSPMILAAVWLVCLSPAAAQNYGGYEHPIYDPITKSYFELREVGTEIDWATARKASQNLEYKETRGRLALVLTPETHSFLQRNFQIDKEAWIGLRYWCPYRKLQWVTGEVAKPGAFSPWNPNWNRPDGIAPCEHTHTKTTGYMSVYYRPNRGGFNWQATGSAKKFWLYFVEYPTGKE